VKINDISISRVHAMIRRVKDEFYLVDLNSKFGTLMAKKGPVKVEEGRIFTVQAGRTVMTFAIQIPLFTCCTR
jgi:hypothetical protein